MDLPELVKFIKSQVIDKQAKLQAIEAGVTAPDGTTYCVTDSDYIEGARDAYTGLLALLNEQSLV